MQNEKLFCVFPIHTRQDTPHQAEFALGHGELIWAFLSLHNLLGKMVLEGKYNERIGSSDYLSDESLNEEAATNGKDPSVYAAELTVKFASTYTGKLLELYKTLRQLPEISKDAPSDFWWGYEINSLNGFSSADWPKMRAFATSAFGSGTEHELPYILGMNKKTFTLPGSRRLEYRPHWIDQSLGSIFIVGDENSALEDIASGGDAIVKHLQSKKPYSAFLIPTYPYAEFSFDFSGIYEPGNIDMPALAKGIFWTS